MVESMLHFMQDYNVRNTQVKGQICMGYINAKRTAS